MFTPDVNSCSWCADASIGRGNIDYAPAGLRQHHSQLMRHAEQSPEDVSVKGCRIALCGLLRYETAASFSRSVVDGHIQAAEARDGLIDQVTHIVFVAHVGTPILRLYADLPEFSD